MKGYLIIITDPSHALVAIESALGMPVRLVSTDNKQIYQSKHWPTKIKDVFVAQYVIKTSRGIPLLSVITAQNISELSASVTQVRVIFLSVSLLGLLLIIIFSSWLIKRTTLTPMRVLTEKLNLVHKDRSKMGLQIEVSGVREVNNLTTGFNEMSQELGNLYRSLESMAYTDSLTNLPNRNQFQESLTSYIQLYKGTKSKFTIFLMDLDRFKGVNDTLGHNIGDELLKAVGSRLHMTLREDDIITRLDENMIKCFDGEMIARLGGDEFAALFPNESSIESAAIVARKLNRALEEPFMINDHCLTVGLSIGIAFYPEHGTDMHTLVRHADIAMYHAKSRKCGFSIYESVQNKNSLYTLKLEQDLFAAIKKDELELHYQPKMKRKHKK